MIPFAPFSRLSTRVSEFYFYLKETTKVKETSTVVRRTFFALFFAAQLLLISSIAHAQPYQIINTQSSVIGGDLSKTVTTIQEGNNPLDRFLITEVKKPVPDQAYKGVIFLLPPLGSGFQNYETAANGDY